MLYGQSGTQITFSFTSSGDRVMYSVSVDTIDLFEFDNYTPLSWFNGLYSDIEIQNNMQTLLREQMQTV